MAWPRISTPSSIGPSRSTLELQALRGQVRTVPGDEQQRAPFLRRGRKPPFVHQTHLPEQMRARRLGDRLGAVRRIKRKLARDRIAIHAHDQGCLPACCVGGLTAESADLCAELAPADGNQLRVRAVAQPGNSERQCIETGPVDQHQHDDGRYPGTADPCTHAGREARGGIHDAGGQHRDGGHPRRAGPVQFDLVAQTEDGEHREGQQDRRLQEAPRRDSHPPMHLARRMAGLARQQHRRRRRAGRGQQHYHRSDELVQGKARTFRKPARGLEHEGCPLVLGIPDDHRRKHRQREQRRAVRLRAPEPRAARAHRAA